MKIKTLIERLSKFNPEATVKLHRREGEEVLFTVAIEGDDDNVWLETESDNDMGSEIDARFDGATEYWDSELDFYMDLLETGINVAMVRKYMGDELANHMEEFCIEHGLI